MGNMQRVRTRRGRALQRGAFMIELSLALLLSMAAAYAALQTAERANRLTEARLQADQIRAAAEATSTYIFENYSALQQGLPVSKNGVTIAAVNILRPTPAVLETMGYQSIGTATAILNPAANIISALYRVPAGCVAAACDIVGSVGLDRPLLRAAGGEDAVAIGRITTVLGGDGGSSYPASTTLSGNSGWSLPNPVAGTPAGVVGVRVGLGASGLGAFVRTTESRPLDFQSSVNVGQTLTVGQTLSVGQTMTVGGNTFIGGNVIVNGTVGTGTGSTGCRLGEILASGEIVSRTNNCVVRAFMNGSTGQQGVANAGGVLRALLNGADGSITSFDAAGAARAGVTYDALSQSVVYADNLRNTANTAGVLQNGTVFGERGEFNVGSVNTLVINTSATAGAACAIPNASVWGTLSGAPILLKCEGSIWTPTNGALLRPVGFPCALDGVSAVSTSPASNGSALICKNGVFMLVSDLLSNFVLMGSSRVIDGELVNKPTCGQLGASTGIPLAMLTGQIESSPNSSFTRRTDSISASQWRVVLQDSNSASLRGAPNAEALLLTYCYY